ncbi:hypothetical protein [Alterisphingorhabdus coralli]|uniref:Uncharacterized protein n=1 Tax=Alterisphingorhabdus coralli TaxID=3071408 RepID=A0AA97F6L4_9SPHN|nr:hypothetical protein [Parasphingorhabdus sp. SCSIO 66989]WOE74896.1 hypothetical protein RB602_13815 [Parasphingorhabdus sp. SCSIO 66989]
MKISQEVREFAANNPNAELGTIPTSAKEAARGMEEMSKLYKEKGEKLYLPEE